MHHGDSFCYRWSIGYANMKQKPTASVKHSLRSCEAKRTFSSPWAEGSLHRTKFCFTLRAPQVRFVPKQKSTSFEVLFVLVTRGGRSFASQISTACFATRKTTHRLAMKPATGSFHLTPIALSGFDSPNRVMYTKQKSTSLEVLFVLVTRGGIEPPIQPWEGCVLAAWPTGLVSSTWAL